MSIRSKLFATVAMPVLSASMVFHPALAANLASSFEVAQAEDPSQGQAQSNEEELLRQQQQQQQAEEAARAAEQQAAEQQAAEQRAAEQQAADEAAAQQQAAQEAEQQRQVQEQQAAEQRAADEAAAAAAAEQQAAEQKAADEAAAAAAAEQQAAEQKAADDAAAAAAAEQQAAEQKAADEAAAAAAAEQQATEQKAADEAAAAAAAEKQAAEQKAADEAGAAASAEQKAAEQKAADDAAAAGQKATDDAAAAEQQRLLGEQKAAEQKAAEDAQKAQEQQPAPAAEQQPAQEQPATAEQPATDPATAVQPAVEGEPPVTGEQPATAVEPQTDPATNPAAEPPQQTTETPVVPAVVPEIVDTATPEQKQEIAADPAQTDETIVLPIEGGAAVLDSDKDADNSGGQTARDERKKLREAQRAEQESVAAPTTDADSQAAIAIVEPATIQAGITEEGQKLDAVPVFVTPGVTNIENNTIINNVTNNTVNNTVINNNITNVVVQQQIDNRTILNVDNQIIIRNDDRPRLRRDSEESYYEELSRGRVRETIVRPNGSRLVTVYDRYGDIIQRSRIDRDGEEYLMVYAAEPEADRPPRIRDIGYELPPMRLRIPVRDYIIDTSSEPDRDYYDFLAEPPVEQVERVYSIDEVKYSARLRDKVRRIDLDTITFATGSAEVPLAQAKTLRKVANAISEVLKKDQGETFLIEGHTDAVGKDQPNLVLSDQRAESVAELLTDVYGIPPENLVTQGYGERFLKVKTQVAEQQNRRVTIRRVTPLVRPVAQK
jgi:outer membrane protein OmpA-like peptidoglycan-associated protein